MRADDDRGPVVDEEPEWDAAIPRRKKLALISQSTQPPWKFEKLAAMMVSRSHELKIVNTVCPVTIRRQEDTVELAREVDLMVVVGGRSSANTKELTRLCEIAGTPAVQVEGVRDLTDPEVFASARAATSGVPAISSTRRATSRRSSIGVDVPPVTPTTRAPSKTPGSVRSASPSIWIAGLPAIPTSRVSSFVFALDRPPTTTIRSTSFAASTVSSWRRIVTGQTVLTILSSWLRPTMNAASFSNFQGGWVDWEIRAIRFLRGTFCSHSSSSSTTIASGAKPSIPTTSAWFGVPSRTIV